MNDFIYKEKYLYPISALLNVTDDCNLTCKYCFVQQQPHYMTLEVGKAAVDWVYSNFQKRKELQAIRDIDKCSIYFFGGEPCLCFDTIIVPLVEYCKQKYPNDFVFGMTTNGTLLDCKKIDWLKENNFQLLLSLDGDQITQDYNRPCKNNNLSSFDLVSKNIPYLLEKYPALCSRTTIYAPTAKYLFDNYLFAERMGFKHFEMIEDSRHEDLWTPECIIDVQKSINNIYAYRLNQLVNNQMPMKVTRMNNWLLKLIEILNNEKKDFSYTTLERCGLGTTSCGIGWNGDIYGCQEQVSYKEKNDFYLGNIFTGGINISKHINLLGFYFMEQTKNIEKKQECTSCYLNKLCQSNYLLCPSSTYDLFHNMSDITNITCELRKIYIENSLILLTCLQTLKGPDYIHNYIKTISQQGGIL